MGSHNDVFTQRITDMRECTRERLLQMDTLETKSTESSDVLKNNIVSLMQFSRRAYEILQEEHNILNAAEEVARGRFENTAQHVMKITDLVPEDVLRYNKKIDPI